MSLIIPPHEQKKLQSAQNRQAFFRIGLAFFVLGIPCQRLDGCSVSYFQTKINTSIYERVVVLLQISLIVTAMRQRVEY